jgi:hypothetical protein
MSPQLKWALPGAWKELEVNSFVLQMFADPTFLG